MKCGITHLFVRTGSFARGATCPSSGPGVEFVVNARATNLTDRLSKVVYATLQTAVLGASPLTIYVQH